MFYLIIFRNKMQNTTIVVCRMHHLCYFGYADFAVPLHRGSDITAK